MNTLLERMKQSGSIKVTTLAESSFFNEKDIIQTPVPIINVAFSGKVDGGFCAGLTTIAGESKNYKSLTGLMCVASYLNKYEDGVCLFYDSEFGVTPDYLSAQGIDISRVIHIPVEHIEQLKFDIVKRLNEVKRGDHVIIFIDSIGNLASIKEATDALNENNAGDMSRPKSLKGLFRIITPHLTTKNIPCIVINHVYKTMELYSKNIVSGGTGSYYSSMNIFIISRSQEKEGTEVTGWNFTLNIEKSRFIKEKSKLTFQVLYDGGIDKYSGLFDLAIEFGLVKQSGAWYQLVDLETGVLQEKKIRQKDIGPDVFDSWLANDTFKTMVEEKYMLSTSRKNEEDGGNVE